ncbi:MAG: hypothetical protein JJ900_12095 [Rhodospirillales bacterium]|nr:hypothetical protein [Rhodospirillales bacterium]MBO6787584.1 hypothetical protein [Rhodospirillales bacterium]
MSYMERFSELIFKLREIMMSLTLIKYHYIDGPPIKVSKALIYWILPKETGPIVWGDLSEIFTENLRKGTDEKSMKRWLWGQTLRTIWPCLKWRIRLSANAFLKLAGLSQAVEWIVSKF